MSRIIVPVSGGKDSQLCAAMAVEQFGADRVLGLHEHTGFDHPLTYEHMDYMRERYRIKIINITGIKYQTVPDVIMGEGIIPSRHSRACTRKLKTEPMFRWLRDQPDMDTMLVWLGMRAAESQNRRASYGKLEESDVFTMGDLNGDCPKACAHVKTQLPIVEMTTPAVFAALRKRGDKVNPLYAKGFKRVGCFPCVLAGPPTLKIAARDPVGRDHLALLGGLVQVIEWVRPETNQKDIYEHDIAKILDNADSDPFGFYEEDEEQAGGCSWCNL